jgi:hypothetical protein
MKKQDTVPPAHLKDDWRFVRLSTFTLERPPGTLVHPPRILPKFGGIPQEAEGPSDNKLVQSSTTTEPIPCVHTPEDWIIDQLDGVDNDPTSAFVAEKVIKKHLDKRTAKVVILHLLEGRSFRQMAKEIGGHPSGLWVVYHRGIAKLKPHMTKFMMGAD